MQHLDVILPLVKKSVLAVCHFTFYATQTPAKLHTSQGHLT